MVLVTVSVSIIKGEIIMSNKYFVELDVSLVHRTTVEAESEKEAIFKAEREAQDDSLSTKMKWGCSEVYTIEKGEV